MRKDGSAETRGLREVDDNQPTLRDQFLTQQHERRSQDEAAPAVPDSNVPAAATLRDGGAGGGGSSSPIRTTGLRRSPLTGGVHNASEQFDLPSPAVAVRNLVEQAQLVHLCTVMSTMHHRRAGYPFGTLVDFASDGVGYPIFCMSPLGIHTRNIVEDPRCSVVVQLPGWTGLANARVTIFGDVYQLPPEQQGIARQMFVQKHAKENTEEWLSGNSVFFRMHRISDIYFVGGFGTVQWVDVSEYTAAMPDAIAMHKPHRVLRVLNDTFASGIQALLKQGDQSASAAEFISIDRLGADVRARFGADYSVERVAFDEPVHTLEEALACVDRLVRGPSSTPAAAAGGGDETTTSGAAADKPSEASDKSTVSSDGATKIKKRTKDKTKGVD